MSEFEARREAALKLLKESGIRESNYCPPLLRLLWRFGFQVPPPHFASFASVAAFAGVFFAVAWGTIVWFVMWRSAATPPMVAVFGAAAAGTLFGLSMGAYYAYGRKKHGLPAWSSLKATSGA